MVAEELAVHERLLIALELQRYALRVGGLRIADGVIALRRDGLVADVDDVRRVGAVGERDRFGGGVVAAQLERRAAGRADRAAARRYVGGVERRGDHDVVRVAGQSHAERCCCAS